MRGETLINHLRLAIQLQGRVGGMTITEMANEFDVSRRTAERMRDAIEGAFGPLLLVDYKRQTASLAT